uniref:(northern house mosquito) hypothetical protein n=1 Tax=Culex pipiens TaxID=7175 RepID=A0A8D8AJ09_CULPI
MGSCCCSSTSSNSCLTTTRSAPTPASISPNFRPDSRTSSLRLNAASSCCQQSEQQTCGKGSPARTGTSATMDSTSAAGRPAMVPSKRLNRTIGSGRRQIRHIMRAMLDLDQLVVDSSLWQHVQ